MKYLPFVKHFIPLEVVSRQKAEGKNIENENTEIHIHSLHFLVNYSFGCNSNFCNVQFYQTLAHSKVGKHNKQTESRSTII